VILKEMRGNGVHTILSNPDCRLLWYSKFQGCETVSDQVFLLGLSDFLAEEKGAGHLADRLAELEGPEADAVRDVLDRNRDGTVHLTEIRMAFGKEDRLVARIGRIVGGGAASPNTLPTLDTGLMRRLALEKAIAGWMLSSRCIVLVAGSDAGKTVTAVGAGHAAHAAGQFARGAFLSDLKGVPSVAAALRKVAFDVGIILSDSADARTDTLLGSLRSKLEERFGASGRGEMLVALDGCEQLVGPQPGGEPDLGGVVSELLESVPWVRVLVTSRVDVAVPGSRVEHLSGITPAEFLAWVAESMPEREARARALVQAFGFSTSALQCLIGLLSADDEVVRALTRGASATDHTDRGGSGVIRAALLATPVAVRAAVARLTIFPGGFGEDAVREVGGCDGLEGLSAALEVGLVKRNDFTGRLSIHDAVREAVRAAAGDEVVGARDAFMGYVGRVAERVGALYMGAGLDSAMALLEEEAPTVYFALRLAGGPGEGERGRGASLDGSLAEWAGEGTAGFVTRVSAAFKALAMKIPFARMRAAAERGLSWARAAHPGGAVHGDAAHWLGEVLRVAAEYPRAQECYEEALEIRTRTFGREHALTAATLNYLAQVHKHTGDLGRALALLDEALAIRSRVHGRGSALAGATMKNRGEILAKMGRYDEALAGYAESLEVRAGALGRSHPETLNTVAALGSVYLDKGEPRRALELLQEAYEGRRRVTGDAQQRTVTVLYKIARAHRKLGDLGRSMAVLEEVLETQVRVLGRGHPRTAETIATMANVHAKRGRHDEAIRLFEEALATETRALGRDHPTTAWILNCLAAAYCGRGEAAKALPLFEEVRDTKIRRLGPAHPDVALSLNGLAWAHRLTGDLVRSVELYEEAVAISAAARGRGHPEVAVSLNYLAEALFEAGSDDDRCLALWTEAAAALEGTLGRAHPYTCDSLCGIAAASARKGRVSEAAALQEEVLATRTRVLGADHPATVEAAGRLEELRKQAAAAGAQ